jgi:UDP-N-acetyl-D-mannosaminuronic acid dehydrogenase
MKKLNIAVIGLGFIGLPLSLSYARKGAHVVGIDVSESLIAEINQGISHHLEYFEGKSLAEILQEQRKENRFYATSQYEQAAGEVDHYIITVGIPVRNGDPDLSFLISACESLAKVLKRGDCVILRSTVVPGTTEEVVKPILEKSGLKAGEDFYLAYSSERIAEGRAFEEFITMPLAVGGINQASALRAKEALAFVTEADIAMVQQFARFAEKMGIDTFELIRVANTHKRVQLLTPGPGVGGYCLPNALYYLLPKAQELGVNLSLLETARQINDQVPRILVTMLKHALAQQGKTLVGSKIAVLGLAMKDFSNDDRISPPHHVVEILLEEGALVKAYDPAVPTTYDYKVDQLDEAIQDADGLIYLTVQEEFLEINWLELIQSMNSNPVLLDGKNRIPRIVEESATLLRI